MFPTFRDWERKVEDAENPTNVALPINLQTPQTYTFQSFKPRKHTPTNPYIYNLGPINQY
jgi:hypothetical protein